MRSFKVVILGATGAVGAEVVRVLEQRDFPVSDLRLLASPRSAGRILNFRGSPLPVEAVRPEAFAGFEIAFFAAGGSVSLEYAPKAAGAGCVVIDKTSAYREDPDVPLIVPEVNPHHLPVYRMKGIISSPNCSTIPLVMVLKPLHEAAGIKRVVVSTYQSVSGAGAGGMQDLEGQTGAIREGRPIQKRKFTHQIAFNVIPHIDSFLADGSTKEEAKMANESRKILDLPGLPVSATTVRVPVFVGHSESVNIELERPLTAGAAREVLSRAPGLRIIDDPSRAAYPMPIDCAGTDETFVGRVREDPSVAHGLNMWLCCDNLRKGAALNAVQIAELFIGQ
ncbi:MAG: aspartate-semialdehyde dehydrogenase [Deltaproteobacteria bacterium]|nr:aspartate-semialdehyde dehydrogenase [Deltaproteobacteria bacterium]